MTARRTAGLALVGFVLATFAPLLLGVVPGGDFEPDKVSAFAGGGQLGTIALGYLAMLGSLLLIPFARAVRPDAGPRDTVWALGVAGAAAGVVGGTASAGLGIALLEGGDTVRSGLPLPVVHTLGEMTNLLLVCAPVAVAGVIALVLARTADLPAWVRIASLVGGVCGITAPLFVTYFLFVLWGLVVGGWLIASGVRVRSTEPETATASLV